MPAGTYGKRLPFANFGLDNSMWGPLLEKAWAKANVNYESIIGGRVFEGWDFLTSAPHQIIRLEYLSADALWDKVSGFDL